MNTEAIGNAVHAVARAFHPAAYVFIPVLKIKDRFFDGGEMKKTLDKRIQIHCTPAQRADKAYMRRLKRDMWYSFILYNCLFSEYFLFDFPRLSYLGRREFVTEPEKIAVCRRIAAENPEGDIFRDKYTLYTQIREYYRRDAVKIDENATLEDFQSFAALHPQFIVKPHYSSCGEGVRILDMREDSRPAEELFRQLQEENVIAEELIVQSEILAALHPSSINTVRIATFVKDGEAHILFTFLRVGRGGAVVDNAAAGGIAVPIDMETGIVNGPGRTEDDRAFSVHPETGAQIVGLVIPRWEEVKNLALTLAMRFPTQKYIGWDFALTDGGWVVVEGNNGGQFVCPQMTSKRGIRGVLEQYFDL